MDTRTPGNEGTANDFDHAEHSADMAGFSVSNTPLEAANPYYELYQRAAGIAHAADATVRSIEITMSLHNLREDVKARTDGLKAGAHARDVQQLPPIQLFLTPADAMAEEPLKLTMPLDALPVEVLPHLYVLVSAITDIYTLRMHTDWARVVGMTQQTQPSQP